MRVHTHARSCRQTVRMLGTNQPDGNDSRQVHAGHGGPVLPRRDHPIARKSCLGLVAVAAALLLTMGFASAASASDLNIASPANGSYHTVPPTDLTGESDSDFISWVPSVVVTVTRIL